MVRMAFLKEPKGIVIHHSATRDTSSISYDVIKKYHKDVRKWAAIGYHYVIEQVGDDVMVLTGRGVQYKGAHARGSNNSIGICVVGNFDKDRPSNRHLEVLFRLLRSLLFLYPTLVIENIKFHKEVGNTSCPGHMFPSIDIIRSRLELAGDLFR